MFPKAQINCGERESIASVLNGMTEISMVKSWASWQEIKIQQQSRQLYIDFFYYLAKVSIKREVLF